MALVFDPAKDVANITKHGVSLARAADLEEAVIEIDARFTSEARFRAFGLIDGSSYCLAFTVRGDDVRAISLRRTHLREHRRHVR